jgi:hypothetical protein
MQMDEVIPPNGTRSYYEAVTAGDSSVHEYYKLFEAPVMGHCFGTKGGYPSTMFESLIAWVESGNAPTSLPVKYSPEDGKMGRHTIGSCAHAHNERSTKALGM